MASSAPCAASLGWRERTGDLYIFGAARALRPNIAKPLGELRNERIVAAIAHCIQQGRHEFSGSYTTIYLRSGDSEGAIYLETSEPITEIDKQLIEVFATSISACFGNIKLVDSSEFVAYHDPLTGLGNRSQFILDLDHLGAARHTDHVVALLDIEHFADINDGLGHEVGNLLLQSIACRLVHALPDCRVSRIGADVFGIHGPGAQMQPDRLLALMEEPFLAGEHALPIGGTLGWCGCWKAAWAADAAQARQHRAEPGEKSLHARYEYFIEDMEDKTKWRLEIIRHLRQDFSDRKLSVWYQPQVALSTGQVVGIEALLRWPSPTRPADSSILRACSSTGRVLGADHRDRPLGAGAGLPGHGQPMSGLVHAPNKVAVNVSMPQFRHQQLQHAGCMTPWPPAGLPAGQLELESLKAWRWTSPNRHRRPSAAQVPGVRIAIDDFGAGYSSWATCASCPSTLAEDRSELRAGDLLRQGRHVRRDHRGAGAEAEPRHGGGGRGDRRAGRFTWTPGLPHGAGLPVCQAHAAAGAQRVAGAIQGLRAGGALAGRSCLICAFGLESPCSVRWKRGGGRWRLRCRHGAPCRA